MELLKGFLIILGFFAHPVTGLVAPDICDHRLIQELRVEEQSGAVTVRGSISESMRGIKRVKVKKVHGEVRVLVHLGIHGKRTSDFKVVIPLNPSVKQITFGKERYVLWPTLPGAPMPHQVDTIQSK